MSWRTNHFHGSPQTTASLKFWVPACYVIKICRARLIHRRVVECLGPHLLHAVITNSGNMHAMLFRLRATLPHTVHSPTKRGEFLTAVYGVQLSHYTIYGAQWLWHSLCDQVVKFNSASVNRDKKILLSILGRIDEKRSVSNQDAHTHS